jgi:porin
MRVKYNITPEFYAQVGAYEQNPSNLETGNGFKLSGSGTKGAILPVELVWSPKVNGLPGEYRLVTTTAPPRPTMCTTTSTATRRR